MKRIRADIKYFYLSFDLKNILECFPLRRLRDDFQFDALSHGSSQGSVQLGMGTVSAVQTPQGSCDNMDSLDLLTDSLRGTGGGQTARSLLDHQQLYELVEYTDFFQLSESRMLGSRPISCTLHSL